MHCNLAIAHIVAHTPSCSSNTARLRIHFLYTQGTPNPILVQFVLATILHSDPDGLAAPAKGCLQLFGQLTRLAKPRDGAARTATLNSPW